MKRSGRRIRGIWIADVAHHGQSGILNERILGNDRKSPSDRPLESVLKLASQLVGSRSRSLVFNQ